MLWDFQIFCIRFQIFIVVWFPVFFGRFPQFFDPFPHFFYPFPLYSNTLKSHFVNWFSKIFMLALFSKIFKISICWSISSDFWSVPDIFDPFPLFSKTFKISFVDQFPHNFGPFPHIFYPFPLFTKFLANFKSSNFCSFILHIFDQFSLLMFQRKNILYVIICLKRFLAPPPTKEIHDKCIKGWKIQQKKYWINELNWNCFLVFIFIILSCMSSSGCVFHHKS